MSTYSASIFLLLIFNAALVWSLNETAETLISFQDAATETSLSFNNSVVYFHRMILVDMAKMSEINSFFTFSLSRKSKSCQELTASKIKFSLGATRAGLLEGEVTVQYKSSGLFNGTTEVDVRIESASVTAYGSGKFVLNITSNGIFKLRPIGQMEEDSGGAIQYAFDFDKFNATHYAIPFAAYYTEKGNGCDYAFYFPDYEALNEPIVVVEPPKENPTPTSAELTEPPSSDDPKNDSGDNEENKDDTNSASIVIYVVIGIGSFLIGFIIAAAASFFLLPKLPFFKKRNSEDPSGTTVDVETTKLMPVSSTYQDETNLESRRSTTKATKPPTASPKKAKKNKRSGDKESQKDKTLNNIPSLVDNSKNLS